MSSRHRFDRRRFLADSLAAAAAAGAVLGGKPAAAADAPAEVADKVPQPGTDRLPCGMLGKAKLSRLMLGGNLVSGCMHSRDLHYVTNLFRAYVTEEKMLQTLKLAEENGVNTPKELRKEYIWLDGGKGWYDNMWCINPEETVEFMRTVTKPWIAFKILAAGAILPVQGFAHAFRRRSARVRPVGGRGRVGGRLGCVVGGGRVAGRWGVATVRRGCQHAPPGRLWLSCPVRP